MDYQVVITNGTVSISATLADGKSYAVNIPNTAFKDLANNAYELNMLNDNSYCWLWINKPLYYDMKMNINNLIFCLCERKCFNNKI